MMNAATRITSRTAVTRRFVSSLATNAGKRKPTNLHHLSTLPFRQVIRPTVVQTFSTGGARTPSSREPVAQPPVIHLQASADLKNQTTLTEAVANAISRCGGHLSTQMIDNDTNISTFVFEMLDRKSLPPSTVCWKPWWSIGIKTPVGCWKTPTFLSLATTVTQIVALTKITRLSCNFSGDRQEWKCTVNRFFGHQNIILGRSVGNQMEKEEIHNRR